MSLITYGELEFGALRSNNSRKAMDLLEEITAYIPAQPLPVDTAKQYANIRAALTAKGTFIENNDLWIAAHARLRDDILVTNNIREFERVENLRVENWA